MREAQKRSRGLARLHTLRSATCGPSTATMRKIWPARTGHARPERRGHDEPLDQRRACRVSRARRA